MNECNKTMEHQPRGKRSQERSLKTPLDCK